MSTHQLLRVHLLFAGLCWFLQGDRVKELKDGGRPKVEVQEAVVELKLRKKHLEAKVRGGVWSDQREGVWSGNRRWVWSDHRRWVWSDHRRWVWSLCERRVVECAP